MSDTSSNSDSGTFICQQLCDANQTARCNGCRQEVAVPCFKESSGTIKCPTPKCSKGLQYYTVTWDIDRSDAMYPPDDSRFKCDDPDCDHPRPYLGGAYGNETKGFCVKCLCEGDILWADGKVIYDNEIPLILQGYDQETVFEKTERS